MAPVFEALAKDFPDVAFAKFNCHEGGDNSANADFAAAMRIRALPTFALYRTSSSGGLKLVAEVTGARAKELRRAVITHSRGEVLRYWG